MTLNQNNDEEFLSLLSTQREILRRLKREKNVVANKGENLIPLVRTVESKTTLTPTPIFGDDSDPFNLMNDPIIERCLGHGEMFEKVESQRISGFGILPTCHVPSNVLNEQREIERQKMIPTNRFQMNAAKSRRDTALQNSLRGMLANAFVFDTDSSTTERAPSNADFFSNAFMPQHTFRRKKRLDSNIDLASEFVNFVAAMEKSMKSQQDIHEWDRKMGLRRSHSKTMRLSMRSRNRLRNVVINV